MSKNKKIKIFFGIIAALLIIVGVSSFVTQIPGATFGGDECKDKDSACVGRFTNVKCTAQGEESVLESPQLNNKNSWKFYKCGYGDLDSNTPNLKAYVNQCKFLVSVIDDHNGVGESVNGYSCQNSFTIGDPSKSSLCSPIRSGEFDDETSYKQIMTGRSGDANLGTLAIRSTSNLIGTATDYKVRIDAQPYFLEKIQGDNFRSQDVSGCRLTALLSSKSIVETDNVNVYQGEKFLAFNGIANWIWGYEKYSGVNIIQDYLGSGKDVYVQKAGFYIPIKTTETGIRYASFQDEISSSKIECVPSEPNCDDNGKLVKDDNQRTCGDFRGFTNEYVPRNDGTSCTYKCVSNKPSQSCVKTADCGDGERVDFASNKCVKVDSSSSRVVPLKQNNKPLWIAIGIIIVGILIAIIIMTTGKKRK